MPKIDWSKQIELYDKKSGEAYADAEVIASDLKGRHPYVIRWTIPDYPSIERVDTCSADGSMLWYAYHVRNKPVARRRLIIVAITSGGHVVHHMLRVTREGAEKDLRNMLDTGEYVAGQVVELEWTEE